MTQLKNATEGASSETWEQTSGQTWLEKEIAARHALFDDAETAKRDEDDLPVDRGASGANLRWCEVLGDPALDRRLRRAAWRLQNKHKNSNLDAEEVAQRIRIRLIRGQANYRKLNGLAADVPLRFNRDWGWMKYAQTVIKNTCASFADRMEREAKANRLNISRDARGETDEEGDEVTWREHLDFRAACDEFDRDEHLDTMVANGTFMTEATAEYLLTAFYEYCSDAIAENVVRVSTGTVSVYPMIGGSFDSEDAAFDPTRNTLYVGASFSQDVRNAVAGVTPTYTGEKPAGSHPSRLWLAYLPEAGGAAEMLEVPYTFVIA